MISESLGKVLGGGGWGRLKAGLQGVMPGHVEAVGVGSDAELWPSEGPGRGRNHRGSQVK